MPTPRLTRRRARAALAVAVAVAVGYCLIPPAAPPPMTPADAAAALDAMLLTTPPDSPDGGPIQTRLYDVRDLLADSFETRGLGGPSDLLAGQFGTRGRRGPTDLYADPELALMQFLRRLVSGPQPRSGESLNLVGGRLIVSHRPAAHARIAAALAALRLVPLVPLAPISPPPPTAEEARVAPALARHFDSYDADGRPAADEVARWSRLAGAPVAVDWPALRAAGIDPSAPVRLAKCSAGQALLAILATPRQPNALDFYADGGTIRVGLKANRPRRAVLVAYDLRPLLFAAARRPYRTVTARGDMASDFSPEAVIRTLEFTIAREDWALYREVYGGTADTASTAAYWSGRLLVRATPESQRKVADLLVRLGPARTDD